MSDVRAKPWLSLLAAVSLLALSVGGALYSALHLPVPPVEKPNTSPQQGTTAQVEAFCSRCHALPLPRHFPAWAWSHEVELMYWLNDESSLGLKPPPLEQVIDYYENRAPLEVPLAPIERSRSPLGISFNCAHMPHPSKPPTAPKISNVQVARLRNDQKPVLLACEMHAGLVMSLDPSAQSPSWKVLGRVSNPARVEVVDLDGDGITDLLVANLGSFPPTDELCGSVVWLQGNRDGTYTPHTLLSGVGRVADVRAADFRGTGKLDLVVAVFGWRKVGEILLLENHTTHRDSPKFIPRTLDRRHGAIHTVVADLNKDGKPDIVALLAQEHETVVAFINEGQGQFRQEIIFTAPDPCYGSSGIDVVDLDGDGHLDVLYTNGDVMDPPFFLKPYHGIRWLENRGTFPFTEHLLAPMYGVHRAVATDLSDSGRLDIVAVSLLPEHAFASNQRKESDSVIILEQVSRGKFVRHTLEKGEANHVTCAVGDVWGRQRQDIIIGNFGNTPDVSPVSIWKNLGGRGGHGKP